MNFAGGSDDGLLPAPNIRFDFDMEGVKSYASRFPKCTVAQAQSLQHATLCARAVIGSGVSVVKIGPPGIPQQGATSCTVPTILYDFGGGIAQRLDAPPSCPIPIASAVADPWSTTVVDGLRSARLSVLPPARLIHPRPGLNVVVAAGTYTINRVVRTIRIPVRVRGRTRVRRVRRRVGYISAVGCRGRSRTLETVFTPEVGRPTIAVSRDRC